MVAVLRDDAIQPELAGVSVYDLTVAALRESDAVGSGQEVAQLGAPLIEPRVPGRRRGRRARGPSWSPRHPGTEAEAPDGTGAGKMKVAIVVELFQIP